MSNIMINTTKSGKKRKYIILDLESRPFYPGYQKCVNSKMFCFWDFDECDSGLKIENCSVLGPKAPQTGRRPVRSTWLCAKIPDVTLLPLLLAGE